jgi:hypothetical protein
LRFLSNAGLPLGVAGEVVANTPEGGIVTVRIDGTETTLGQAAAEKLLVTAPGE